MVIVGDVAQRPRTIVSPLVALGWWVCWLAVLVLPSFLLSQAPHIRLIFQQVETTEVIPNLPWFGVVYMIWGTATLVLLVGRSDRRGSVWSDFVLVNVFALVFWNYWNLATPLGGLDSYYNASIVRFVTEIGHLRPPWPPGFTYLDFPGAHLLATSLVQITGLDVLHANWALRLAAVHIYVTVCYVLFGHLCHSRRLALLCTLVLMVGSLTPVSSAPSWAPAILGAVLLAVAWLVVVGGTESGMRPGRKLMFFIAASGLTVSYFVNTMMVMGIALVAYLVSAIRGRTRGGLGLGVAGLVVLVVIAWAWYEYWTAGFLSSALTQFFRGSSLQAPTQSFQSGVIGVPWWATASRLVWLGFLAAGTGVIVLRFFAERHRAEPVVILSAGALFVVAGLSVVAVAASSGGFQFHRFLLVAPLFVVPLTLGWRPMGRLVTWRSYSMGRLICGSVVALLWFSLLPAFLLVDREIGSVSTYQAEITMSDFIHREFARYQQIDAYAMALSQGVAPYLYALPYASVITDEPNRSLEEFWPNLESLVARYVDTAGQGRPATFLWSEKAKGLAFKQGISPTDSHWNLLLAELDGTSRVYDNGLTALYAK